ncbi:unnamed protein product [Blepharisma stoltei]|uniref:Uncharacterized protein n=1 Tax=Blepharisma stoltei TaxID=1481888 RepID=A0AAU9J126_9CILI|nr:unnamed protein product [Blepharisma stoltei]
MLNKFWSNDLARFKALKSFYLKIWSRYEKWRLSDVRALMHLHEYQTREKLLNYDPNKSTYKWVLVVQGKK